GLITTTQTGSLTNATGRVYLYSSLVDLTSATGVTTRAGFESLILGDSLTSLSVRNVAFTNGAVASNLNSELGAVGNRLYLWIESGDATSYGAYKGVQVPALGTLSINSGSVSDLGVGTSVFSSTGTSGYQLAFVPEPSAALLGAVGLLGLLRRRRN
ncbi:MAG: MYXO-CTERM sorting domain-containing protein, partial [Luteolibacter sp.]